MDTPGTEQSGSATVELRKDDCRISLSIQLAEDYTGGPVVRLGPGVRALAIESVDASAPQSHWLSGIASGAFYAYRTLKEQRRVLLISNLQARLHLADTSALAYAAARAVAVCLHRDLVLADSEGWKEVAGEGFRNGVQSAPSTRNDTAQPAEPFPSPK